MKTLIDENQGQDNNKNDPNKNHCCHSNVNETSSIWVLETIQYKTENEIILKSLNENTKCFAESNSLEVFNTLNCTNYICRQYLITFV